MPKSAHNCQSNDWPSRLRQDPAFVSVQNGEPVNTEQDRAYFFNNRYLLSSAITPARFEIAGLRDALLNKAWTC
ncbi:MAG: hypothetical protein IPN04_06980 [Rhodoferax sp.]|nr:hypothetical protein [Rhodoferax sp.]